MRWCCFLYWFNYRLILACLAHFNWLIAIYVNCIYFVLWKTYDLFWFWMHLILCICFRPLRKENYLIVWCNLLLKRRLPMYRHKKFRDIYNIYYRGKKTKSEKELERINTIEKRERDQAESDESSDENEEKNMKIDDTGDVAQSSQPNSLYQNQGLVGETSNVYPVPPPRQKKYEFTSPGIINENASQPNVLHSSGDQREDLDSLATNEVHWQNSSESDESSGGWLNFHKLIPRSRRRKSDEDENKIDVLYPNFKNVYDLKTEKEKKRREKRDRKALTKRLRARRKAELAVIAKKEARERMVSDAIELFLQILRMMASFAILIGNIRKTFIPVQFKWLKPGQHAYDNPELIALFRSTVFLDILLFWINVLWTYCRQCHLCCRLGIFKFWLWLLLLSVIGGVFMILPMSYVQKNLDISWCTFLPNATLARYQPTW